MRQHYRPCSSSNPSFHLEPPNHAAFLLFCPDGRKHTYTQAEAVEIRRTARKTQLKRSSVIKLFLRSAKVLGGFDSLKQEESAGA